MTIIQELMIFSLATADPSAADLSSGSVNVNSESAIPDPSAILLLGFGLAGLGFFRQRKKVA